MDENRVMMKGRHSELLSEQKQLRLKASGRLKVLALALNPALREFEEMDIAQAAATMDELVVCQAELLSLQSKINRLEEALYG